MKSNWLLKTVDNKIINEFSESLEIDKTIASILVSRGITELHTAHQFLNPKLSNLHSPYLMKGMHEAVTRIRTAIEKNENISIFADSDVDGLTSLTVIMNLFERIGIKPFYRYAVDDEEYGLRNEIIDEMHNLQTKLLITLDCGIRDIDEIKYAKELGIDVIVCDHHEQKNELPQAIIVNPKVWECGYPFKQLAGVGVTFKLCHGLLMSYLLSFNKLFVVVTEENDFFYISFIRNGIVEKIDKLKSIPDIVEQYENIFNGDCNVVLFEIDDEEKFRNLFKNDKIFNFKNLLSLTFENKIPQNSSLDNLCREFSINQNIYRQKHHVVNMIFSEIEYYNSVKISQFLNSVIDLVSLGTVADIMPLHGENRTLIHYGLKSLNQTSHPGLSILANKISSKITAKKIAWEISPLLNTPGRFGKTHLIANFFLEKDKDKLKSLIKEINSLNDKRKKIVTDLYNNFFTEIQSGYHSAGEDFILITSEKIPEGLCGLLANRITDISEKPVIVISLSNNKETVKGSGRAKGNYDFFSVVEAYSYLFERIGGHKQAFGFTIERKNIPILKQKIAESGKTGLNNTNVFNIDIDIPIEMISHYFINNLDLLEPYGHQNEECLFLTRNIEIKDFKRFGQSMNHGKYLFQNNTSIEGIGWDMADNMELYSKSKNIDIIYTLENNYYNGYIYPRMMIVDIDYSDKT